MTDRFDSLSEREREIFQLIAEGHSNKEIAELLSVSPATIETHRAHILQKLDVHNTAEIVLYAVRRGVISECNYFALTGQSRIMSGPFLLLLRTALVAEGRNQLQVHEVLTRRIGLRIFLVERLDFGRERLRENRRDGIVDALHSRVDREHIQDAAVGARLNGPKDLPAHRLLLALRLVALLQRLTQSGNDPLELRRLIRFDEIEHHPGVRAEYPRVRGRLRGLRRGQSSL